MLKNVITVLRGTVAAQALGFVALPILTRLFDPEAFGIAQLYQSTLALLLVFAAMRFEVALLKAADGQELAATIQLCFLVNIAATILVAFGCVTIAIFIKNISTTMQKILWWLPLGVLVAGFMQSLGYLLLRDKAFSAIADSKIAQSSSYVVISLGFGAIFPHPVGLIISDILGRITTLAIILKRHDVLTAMHRRIFSVHELLIIVHKFRAFPLVSVPGGFINAAGGAMTVVLMYGTFDTIVAGQFALVERSLMLPVGMVGAAVAQVFTSELSARLRTGTNQDASQLYRSTVKRMLILGSLPAIAVFLFAPIMFTKLFGPNWVLAGELARIMAPYALVAFATTAVNMTIMILGWQKIQLSWEILRLIFTVTIWLCVKNFELNPNTAIALHAYVGIFICIIYLILADIMIRRYKGSCQTISLSSDKYTGEKK